MQAVPPTTATTEGAHVRISGLTLERSGRRLVEGLDLAIPRGRLVAVVGPSGAGKSTFLESLGGLRVPQEGSITYCCRRQCMHAPPGFRRHMGFVFQQLHLPRQVTVVEGVLAGSLSRHPWWRTVCGFPREERGRAMGWMTRLGLDAYGQRRVRQLSGGEQQRVALARALMQDPELILADEPVSQLDTVLAERVLGLLREVVREQRQTVLCVLHDLQLVRRFADGVLSLSGGGGGRWAYSDA